MYYVVINEPYHIPYCSWCGEYPICNYKYSECYGRIYTITQITQYFISPILISNKNHINILFNKFIKLIDINKFKIKLRLLDFILNTKLTKILFYLL